MAKEAQDAGYDFHYANLALRGSKLEKIMTGQLYKALALQPDLVTVMAGSNDLLSKEETLPKLRASYRNGLQELLAAGADIVVANTINPLHLKVFKPLRYRAERFTELIEDVASEFEIPVLDVYGIHNFKELMFWAEDMVHFSGHGHIAVANQAAKLLDLNYRFPELDPQELTPVSRSLVDTATWVKRDVIPFFQRKLKGVTSGDGLDAKHQKLENFTLKVDHPGWELLRL